MGSTPTPAPTPSSPLRIAVLEADTPLTRTRTTYGSYGGVFSALLARGAEALGWGEDPAAVLQISRWDVVVKGEYPALEGVDGVLVTGSSMFVPGSFVRASLTGNGDCRVQLFR